MNQALLKTEIKLETDVVSARKTSRELARLLGFDLQDQTRIATAVSEIARNTYQYATSGKIDYKIVKDDHVSFIITIKDEGNGIKDLDKILNGTYVSPEGMGVGIIGAKRLMDNVKIETSSSGTAITLKKIIPYRKTILSNEELHAINDFLIQKRQANPVQELQFQNQEILEAMDKLNEKRDELTHLNQELEDTNRGVVALYAELEEKAEILRITSESKTSFLSDMTHEFRSPLNSILSISQILLSEAKDEKAEERIKQIGFIVKAANGLSDMVNDLLDIAKIEAGKIEVRASQFQLDELFSTMRGLMRNQTGVNDKVNLIFENPPSVKLHNDEGKLTQILRNLISNAMKFTSSGEVRVTASLTAAGLLVFSVKDTGIGISQENQARIFEEFSQIDNPLQKYHKGTGLGLPLTRKLVSLLGGTMGLVSEPHVGSIFTVTIPPSYSGPAEKAYNPSVKSQLSVQKKSSRKVLVVDDEDANRYLITQSLKNEKIEFREASNGLEGFEMARHFLPDLVILDLNMPGSDGFDFIRSCIGQISTRNIPIILYTSLDLDPEDRAYLEQVTTSIVKKDGDIENFSKIVKSQLGLK